MLLFSCSNAGDQLFSLYPTAKRRHTCSTFSPAYRYLTIWTAKTHLMHIVLKLLHWTGDNVALTRRLFMESGLYREEKTEPKTGETTYLDMTINNAIRKRRNSPQKL
jgi:NrS-1  polymerase HBD domain